MTGHERLAFQEGGQTLSLFSIGHVSRDLTISALRVVFSYLIESCGLLGAIR